MTEAAKAKLENTEQALQALEDYICNSGPDCTEEAIRLGVDREFVEQARRIRTQVDKELERRGSFYLTQTHVEVAKAPPAQTQVDLGEHGKQAAPAVEPIKAEPTKALPAWLAKLDHIEVWEEWVVEAAKLVTAGEVEAGEVAKEAERWGDVGAVEFREALAKSKPNAALGKIVEDLKSKITPERVAAVDAGLLVEDEDEDLDEAVYQLPVPVPRGQIVLPVVTSVSELVQLLNQKHAVIGNYGNKCAVLSWERWNVDRRVMVPTFQSFTDFRNRYMNRYVEKETDDGVKKVAAGKFWLSHPGRQTFDAVAFEPGEPEALEGNRINLWRGFAVVPRKGSWKKLRKHIYRVLGGGDWKAGRYIVRWLAWTLQHPGKPAEVVLAFQGDEGAGKGTLARALLKIFGACGLPVSDPKHLVGAFSGHLHHCVFMFLDEAFWAGNVAAEGRLKSLVTEETITIEPKYFGPFQVRNLLHIMMSSNNDWVVPAGHGSRRYAVFKVSSERVWDFEYFNELNAELDAGGIEAMLYDLLQLDLGDWHPKEIYQTAALVEQKQHSLRGLDAWIEAILQKGELPIPCSAKYPNRCLSKNLLASAKEFDRYTNDSRVAKKLQSVLQATEFNVQVARGWAFPSLSDCRRLWEIRNGGSWPWHYDVEEWSKKAVN